MPIIINSMKKVTSNCKEYSSCYIHKLVSFSFIQIVLGILLAQFRLKTRIYLLFFVPKWLPIYKKIWYSLQSLVKNLNNLNSKKYIYWFALKSATPPTCTEIFEDKTIKILVRLNIWLNLIYYECINALLKSIISL